MEYVTRRLRALRELNHAGSTVRVGDEIYCTPIDAAYYLTRNMAAEAPAIELPPTPLAPPPAVAAEPAQPVADPVPETPAEVQPVVRRPYTRRTTASAD